MTSAGTDCDLDAYFSRIGYTGSRSPTLETLNGICLAHVTSIPFENLDAVLNKGISLNPREVDGSRQVLILPLKVSLRLFFICQINCSAVSVVDTVSSKTLC